MKNQTFIFVLLTFLVFTNQPLIANPSNTCTEAALSEALLGLCNAYIKGNNNCLADENRNSRRCIALRSNFARKSGGEDIDRILGNSGGAITDIPPGGGTLTLEGAASITFPANAFEKTNEVKLTVTSDKKVGEIFDEFTAIFQPSTRMSYEVRVITGQVPPVSETVQIEMVVPDELLNAIPSGYGLELFAILSQGSDEEDPYLIFELFPSDYDSITKTVSASIPTAFFYANAENHGKYEATMTLAPTPGQDNSSSTQVISRASVTTTNSSSECRAASISCPVAGGCTVTSPYSPARKHPITGVTRPHYGVDYRAPMSTEVLAASSGIIERAYTSSSYGETIILRHTDGSATLYAHLEERNAQVGDRVSDGDIIGLADSTGKSKGSHLHFEYVPNGQIIQSKNRIDPDACVNAQAKGSVTVSDSGNLADDAFQVSIDGFVIGQTDIGASNTLAISNLKPGTHTLTLVVITAPDDVGTYTVELNDGLTFSDDSDFRSGWAPQGATLTWQFVVPDP